MATYSSYLIDKEYVKVRWQEPLLSAALNRKAFGTTPSGIYSGFSLATETLNLIRHSEDFANAAWTKSNSTATATSLPAPTVKNLLTTASFSTWLGDAVQLTGSQSDPFSGTSAFKFTEQNRTVDINAIINGEEFTNESWTKGATTAALASGLASPFQKNLFKDTESFSGWSKVGTLTPLAEIAPNGDQTATLWTLSTTSSSQSLYLNNVTTPNRTYTVSIYAKASGHRYFAITDAGNSAVIFDLQAGTLTNNAGASVTATITSVGSGWYRCVYTGVITSTSGRPAFYATASASTVSAVAGTGTSGVLVWGAQCEAGTTLTNYTRVDGSYVSNYASTASLWLRTNVTGTENVADPFGGTNGVSIRETTANNEHYIIQQNISVQKDQTYVLSGYFKSANSRRVRLQTSGGYSCGAIFNLITPGTSNSTGVVSSTITSAENGWYRCSIVFRPTSTTVLSISCLSANGTSTSFTGSTSSGFEVYGLQFEQNTSLTPYNTGSFSEPTLLTETTANSTHNITQDVPIIYNRKTFFSVYAKAKERSKIKLEFDGPSANDTVAAAFFDLAAGTTTVDTGAPGTTSGIIDVGNGWYRCWIAGVVPMTSGNAKAYIFLRNDANNSTYAGSTTSGAYFWGAQVNTSIVADSDTLPYEYVRSGLAKLSTITAATVPHYIANGSTTGADPRQGEVYTFSVFAKKAERSTISIYQRSDAYFVYDLNNGTITPFGSQATFDSLGISASATLVGNGWYRLSYTFNAVANSLNVNLRLTNGATNAVTTGYVATPGSGVFIFGPQIEAGQVTTTYTAPAAYSAFASTLREDATTSFHYMSQAVNAVLGGFYVGSVYFKTAQKTVASLGFSGAATNNNGSLIATFDLTGGTAAANGVAAEISPAGNGWYRASIAYTAVADGALNLQILLGNGNSYAGDNTSAVYIFGAQVDKTLNQFAPKKYSKTTATAGQTSRFSVVVNPSASSPSIGVFPETEGYSIAVSGTADGFSKTVCIPPGQASEVSVDLSGVASGSSAFIVMDVEYAIGYESFAEIKAVDIPEPGHVVLGKVTVNSSADPVFDYVDATYPRTLPRGTVQSFGYLGSAQAGKVAKADPSAAVVGSAADVLQGVATHTTLSDAITALSATGGKIYLPIGTFSGPFAVYTDGITIVGQGSKTVISGGMTISGNKNEVSGVYFGGNLTVSGNLNKITGWASSSSVVSLAGVDNSYEIAKES